MKVNQVFFSALLIIFKKFKSRGHHSHVPNDTTPHLEVKLLMEQVRDQTDVLGEAVHDHRICNSALIRQIVDHPDDFFEQV